MALPDGAVHRLGASGNVEGSIWEGRESLLVAALALPGDRAGFGRGCWGVPCIASLQEQLWQAYLDDDLNERRFLVGRASPGEAALEI